MSSLKSVSVLVQKILPKLLWPIYLTLKYDLDLCMSPIKMCSLMRYICMPIMKSLSGLVKKLWTMLKLVIWPIYLTADLEGWPWPWHVCTQNVRLHEIHMHAKYEVSTCIISKVMANVKVGHTKKQIYSIYLTFDLEGWPWPVYVTNQNVQLNEIHMHAYYKVSIWTSYVCYGQC